MKIMNVMFAVSLVAFCAVVLLVNKAQEMCVAVGQLASEDLTKFTFSLAKPDAANIKQSMVELHATLGTILVISIVMLALVLVVGLIKAKTTTKKMKRIVLLLLVGLGAAECAMADVAAPAPRTPETNSVEIVPEKEYSELSKRILDRVTALKGTYQSLSNMTSAAHHEYKVSWVLDDPTKPHSKLNGRRAVFGKDGYWFSLQFYRGEWGGAAVFDPIEFGDLKLSFQFGDGGKTVEIAAITSILWEENQAFCNKHPWQSLDPSLKGTGEPAP